MAQRPLLLKDYLEQDPFSDSSLSFPTKQVLLEAELSLGARLVRSRSKNAFNKLSVVIINAVRNFPASSPARPSTAKRFGRRFWSKKKKGEGDDHKVVTIKDIVRLDSFESYSERRSLCVSSCSSSCSDVDEGSESSSTSTGSLEGFESVEKSPNHRRLSAEKQENENPGIECEQCGPEEEKEQLSPVSIMDFPDGEGEEEEDDDEVTSLCFEQSLVDIERTTHQLFQKIRRFESLVELDSLALEIHFSSDDEEDNEYGVASSKEATAWDLIRRLRSQYHMDPLSEKLLLEFFMESVASSDDGDIEWIIIVACDWINGVGFLKKEEHGGDQLNAMERNGRWRFFEDGKDDVAAEVEVGVLESLIQEIVIDLGMM